MLVVMLLRLTALPIVLAAGACTTTSTINVRCSNTIYQTPVVVQSSFLTNTVYTISGDGAITVTNAPTYISTTVTAYSTQSVCVTGSQGFPPPRPRLDFGVPKVNVDIEASIGASIGLPQDTPSSTSTLIPLSTSTSTSISTPTGPLTKSYYSGTAVTTLTLGPTGTTLAETVVLTPVLSPLTVSGPYVQRTVTYTGASTRSLTVYPNSAGAVVTYIVQIPTYTPSSTTTSTSSSSSTSTSSTRTSTTSTSTTSTSSSSSSSPPPSTSSSTSSQIAVTTNRLATLSPSTSTSSSSSSSSSSPSSSSTSTSTSSSTSTSTSTSTTTSSSSTPPPPPPPPPTPSYQAYFPGTVLETATLYPTGNEGYSVVTLTPTPVTAIASSVPRVSRQALWPGTTTRILTLLPFGTLTAATTLYYLPRNSLQGYYPGSTTEIATLNPTGSEGYSTITITPTGSSSIGPNVPIVTRTATWTGVATRTLTILPSGTLTAQTFLVEVPRITATTTTTGALTATQTPGTCKFGLLYRGYDNPFTAGFTTSDPSYTTFNATFFNNGSLVPEFQGLWNGTINFDIGPAAVSNTRLYNIENVNLTNEAILYQGYFAPNVTGTYTFGFENPNDIAYAWFGTKAYAAWGESNYDLRDTGAFKLRSYSGSFIAGNLYPITILYANAIRYAVMPIYITLPGGSNATSDAYYWRSPACGPGFAYTEPDYRIQVFTMQNVFVGWLQDQNDTSSGRPHVMGFTTSRTNASYYSRDVTTRMQHRAKNGLYYSTYQQSTVNTAAPIVLDLPNQPDRVSVLWTFYGNGDFRIDNAADSTVFIPLNCGGVLNLASTTTFGNCTHVRLAPAPS